MSLGCFGLLGNNVSWASSQVSPEHSCIMWSREVTSRIMLRDRMRPEDSKVSGHTPRAGESERFTLTRHSLVASLCQPL